MQIHRTFALQIMLFDFKSPTIDCLNVERSEGFFRKRKRLRSDDATYFPQ